MNGIMVSMMRWTICGSGPSCKIIARKYIENAPEWDGNLEQR